jgi:hypothetical protein
VTFKDLKKRVNLETTQQQSKLAERLQHKPFWIWNTQLHKQEDIKTNGDCCFNHIIGLSSKDTADKPLYDYEKIIFDSLVTHDGNTERFYGIKSLLRRKNLTSKVLCCQSTKQFLRFDSLDVCFFLRRQFGSKHDI